MQIEISEKAAAGLERLVHEGSFESAEAAVEAAIEHLLEADVAPDARLIESLRIGVQNVGKGGQPLTGELFEQVKARGRARLAGQQT